jgi:hypothetical protein
MIRPRTTLWHFDAGAGAVHHIMNRHRPALNLSRSNGVSILLKV